MAHGTWPIFGGASGMRRGGFGPPKLSILLLAKSKVQSAPAKDCPLACTLWNNLVTFTYAVVVLRGYQDTYFYQYIHAHNF
jgi:hypothetical protein